VAGSARFRAQALRAPGLAHDDGREPGASAARPQTRRSRSATRHDERSLAMSDISSPPPPPGVQAAPDAAPGVGPLTLNIQYTKDLSFEVPGAPEIFRRFAPTSRAYDQVYCSSGAAGSGASASRASTSTSPQSSRPSVITA